MEHTEENIMQPFDYDEDIAAYERIAELEHLINFCDSFNDESPEKQEELLNELRMLKDKVDSRFDAYYEHDDLNDEDGENF